MGMRKLTIFYLLIPKTHSCVLKLTFFIGSPTGTQFVLLIFKRIRCGFARKQIKALSRKRPAVKRTGLSDAGLEPKEPG